MWLMTSGCSWISFAMKWRWLPLSTSSELATDLICGRVTVGSGAVEDLDAGAVHDGPVALFEIGDGVGEGASAMASLPRYISPLPWPMASGLPWRAAIIRSSWPAKMMPSAKAPCSLPSAALTGLDRRRAVLHLVGDEMHDGFGVGVGLELVAALRRARS